MEKSHNQPIATGTWGETFLWEVVVSPEMPPVELITAVACVAIAGKTGGVVLTRNQRGWELLAGHVEPDESPLEALAREAREEGGYIVSSSAPLCYRKITTHGEQPSVGREAAYPYPISYIAYFLTYSDAPIGTITGEEILESRVFSPQELRELADTGDLNEVDYTIIKLGLEASR